jgi:hypothetical protein
MSSIRHRGPPRVPIPAPASGTLGSITPCRPSTTPRSPRALAVHAHVAATSAVRIRTDDVPSSFAQITPHDERPTPPARGLGFGGAMPVLPWARSPGSPRLAPAPAAFLRSRRPLRLSSSKPASRAPLRQRGRHASRSSPRLRNAGGYRAGHPADFDPRFSRGVPGGDGFGTRPELGAPNGAPPRWAGVEVEGVRRGAAEERLTPLDGPALPPRRPISCPHRIGKPTCAAHDPRCHGGNAWSGTVTVLNRSSFRG